MRTCFIVVGVGLDGLYSGFEAAVVGGWTRLFYKTLR